MNNTKAANIIIALRKEGWSDTKITDLIDFIETHQPYEGEAQEAKKYQKQDQS